MEKPYCQVANFDLLFLSTGLKIISTQIPLIKKLGTVLAN